MLLLPLAMALLACSPAETPSAEGQQEEAQRLRPIEGEYVVAYLNEEPPEQYEKGVDPLVTISGDRIHFQSQCVYDDWAYTLVGETLDTGPWQYDEPVAMCARGLSDDEIAIIAVIDAADTLRFVSNGLWINGEGGSVQLRFVPSADDLAGRAVDLTGEWDVITLDGAPLGSGYGIPISADWFGIWWEPGCAGQGVPYTIEGNAFRVTPSDVSGPVCDIGYPEELPEIWNAMSAADTIARAGDGSVTIAGGGRSVTLVPGTGEGANR